LLPGSKSYQSKKFEAKKLTLKGPIYSVSYSFLSSKKFDYTK